ncbi:hypothetical protein L1I30_03885 [Gillisia sp. M10.2A]|uniref:PKD domain-containing protein n=1 Tax=Gillisia lutea TaxID=2909668 RepID=A0ABS9EG25_9FLAO|nr:hypothetical protein [Gillisia lutea]MCF4100799.1 hypothetical protein [Gillisia lutea]
MRTYLKILLSAFIAITFFSCSDDDSLVDLDYLEAPSNLGATFMITQDNSGLVTVIPTGDGAALYSVNFGDGSAASEDIKPGESVEHVYLEGEYDVVVTGKNLTGKEAQGTQKLVVSFLAPEDLQVDVVKDAVNNYKISVSASAENAAMFEVYFGDVDDEEPTPLMIGETVDHIYENVGLYNLRVVALSGGAATTELVQEVSITDPLFLPIDFESTTLNYGFSNFGGGEGAGAPIIDNPDPSGVNTSAKVASYIKVAGSEVWAGTTIALDEPIDFSSKRYVSVDVWSPSSGTPVLFKIENLEDSNKFVEFSATTTVGNQWETLVFDMNAIDPAIEYGRIAFFFNFGTPGTGETYYFDNIKTTRLELVKLPLNFESESLTYSWGGFGGAGGEVIDNPDATGINTSTKVTKLSKGNGAETWAGISLNLDEKVDFSAGTTIKMKVWSPEAGVPILFKFENSLSAPDGNGNPSVVVEVIQNTTASNAWEELSFDLTTFEAFSADINYDRAIVFYDFGNSGEGTDFYFDELRVSSDEEPTSVVLPVNFEYPDLEYKLTAFEGAESVVVENPFSQGINTSNMVVRSTKTVGAQFYAGTTLELEAPIDFSSQQKISIKVYSPKANIPVRLKLENGTDGNIFLEVDANTTVTNEWEVLTFDFSGMDTSRDYSKMIVFFEFIADLPGDGAIYYYDDIQLTN